MLTQEACAVRMNIARTTVTAIYESARRKVADALVHGKRLLITGGCCSFEPVALQQNITEKGLETMRIAVTFDHGEIFQHFGHTEQFKLYDVQDGKITGEQVVDTNGSGHGALAGFLQAAQVDALICGGIGMGAQMALADAGIDIYGLGFNDYYMDSNEIKDIKTDENKISILITHGTLNGASKMYHDIKEEWLKRFNYVALRAYSYA